MKIFKGIILSFLLLCPLMPAMEKSSLPLKKRKIIIKKSSIHPKKGKWHQPKLKKELCEKRPKIVTNVFEDDIDSLYSAGKSNSPESLKIQELQESCRSLKIELYFVKLKNSEPDWFKKKMDQLTILENLAKKLDDF